MKKYELHKFGNSIREKNFSEVELMNTAANMFKHQDEWEPDWKESSTNSYSIKKLRSIGCKPSYTGNFRTCMTTLGAEQYSDFEILINLFINFTPSLPKLQWFVENGGIVMLVQATTMLLVKVIDLDLRSWGARKKAEKS